MLRALHISQNLFSPFLILKFYFLLLLSVLFSNNTYANSLLNPTSTSINSSSENPNNNYRYISNISTNDRTIGDTVWDDLNGNGIQEDGEPGIPGVLVILENEFGNPIHGIENTYTDSLGKYKFENLPLGKFKVKFRIPWGYIPTKAKEGTDANFDSEVIDPDGRTEVIELDIDENNTSIDVGFVNPVELIGIVWYDENEDGLWESNEAGVEGVLATLYNIGDDMVAGTSDDMKFGDFISRIDGYYIFDDVMPGKYYVVFNPTTLPLAYSFTESDAGIDNYIDSDADKVSGITEVFTIISGKDKSGVDAGLVLTCGFIPEVKIGDAVCVDFPVEFEALPTENGYTYFWQFLDDIANPIILGESDKGITDFTWITPGDKAFKLTVSDQNGCFVSMTKELTILSAEDAVCLNLQPMELINFIAEIIDDNKVQLKWSTVREQDNITFEIQHSTDNDRFHTIGSIEGQGVSEINNQYKFYDESPFRGRNYYRIKQMNFDSTIYYSQVESVTINNEDLPDVILFPNPTRETLTLIAATSFEEEASIEVFNSAGQFLEIIQIQAGTNSEEINLSKYDPGFYFLIIKYNGFRRLSHRVLKTR
jgi:SdrD B-like protein/type IX secretion system substrate protein